MIVFRLPFIVKAVIAASIPLHPNYLIAQMYKNRLLHLGLIIQAATDHTSKSTTLFALVVISVLLDKYVIFDKTNSI